MSVLVCSSQPERHGYFAASWIVHTNKWLFSERIIEGRGQLLDCLICGAVLELRHG